MVHLHKQDKKQKLFNLKFEARFKIDRGEGKLFIYKVFVICMSKFFPA